MLLTIKKTKLKFLKERRLEEFNTHTLKERKLAKSNLTSFGKWMSEQGPQRHVGFLKEKILLKETKERKLWRAMIPHIMKWYGRDRDTNRAH